MTRVSGWMTVAELEAWPPAASRVRPDSARRRARSHARHHSFRSSLNPLLASCSTLHSTRSQCLASSTPPAWPARRSSSCAAPVPLPHNFRSLTRRPSAHPCLQTGASGGIGAATVSTHSLSPLSYDSPALTLRTLPPPPRPAGIPLSPASTHPTPPHRTGHPLCPRRHQPHPDGAAPSPARRGRARGGPGAQGGRHGQGGHVRHPHARHAGPQGHQGVARPGAGRAEERGRARQQREAPMPRGLLFFCWQLLPRRTDLRSVCVAAGRPRVRQGGRRRDQRGRGRQCVPPNSRRSPTAPLTQNSARRSHV